MLLTPDDCKLQISNIINNYVHFNLNKNRRIDDKYIMKIYKTIETLKH